MRTPSTLAPLSLMGTVIRPLPCYYQFRLKPFDVEKVCYGRRNVSPLLHDDRIRHVSHLMLLSSHGYTTIIHRRIAIFYEVFHAKQKQKTEWKCGPLGMRDVKDRDANLRMEWDDDYTIAVAEY